MFMFLILLSAIIEGLTHGIGDVLEEFEHGLNDDNETVIEKKQDEAEDPADESNLKQSLKFQKLIIKS